MKHQTSALKNVVPVRTCRLVCLALAILSCSLTPATARHYNETYRGEYLNRVAFPMGGIGAGMVCLEGNGCISHVSVRNTPDIFNEPFMFAAVSIKGLKNGTKLLEGPVQDWKIFGKPGTGNGAGESSYGFPRFAKAEFTTRFPFGAVNLQDPDIPLDVKITGWSPFIPGDADNSSLPAGALEYSFTNISSKALDTVFSYNTSNFMRIRGQNAGNNTIKPIKGGMVLFQDAAAQRPDAGFYEKSVFYSRDKTGTTVNGL